MLFACFGGCEDSPTVRRDGGPPMDTGSIPTDSAMPRPDTNVGDAGPGGENCETRARWVYVVDSSRRLIRFEPDSLTFRTVGPLACSTTSSPFSMAVDRNAVAWVLYQNGQIFHASTIDAECTATGFTPHQAGFEVFGMGFVGDGLDRTGERLFVAGGDQSAISSGDARLAEIALGTQTLSPLGDQLAGWPELTGTAEGELWGFFPGTSPPSISRLNQTTGAAEQTIGIDAIPDGQPMAWAFAFWGGHYYVFLQQNGDPSTNVYRVDPETGSSELVIENSGQRIVGAGVSICAPVTLI